MAWGFWTSLFGPTEDLGRFALQIDLPVGVNGSVTRDELANGELWFDLSASQGGQYNSIGPTIERNGNTVTWTWPAGAAQPNAPPSWPQKLTIGTF